MPASVDATPPLPGLSPVADKALIARFDGGQLSSDAGVLTLREVERRLGVAERAGRLHPGPARARAGAASAGGHRTLPHADDRRRL